MQIFQTDPFFNPPPPPCKQEADINPEPSQTSKCPAGLGLHFRFLCRRRSCFTFIVQQVERVRGAGVRLSVCFPCTPGASCRTWHLEASALVFKLGFTATLLGSGEADVSACLPCASCFLPPSRGREARRSCSRRENGLAQVPRWG